MIRTLRVRDFALIDELELELEAGLNVITGETGAGKSILVGAVTALCGRRLSADTVRSGSLRAAVEALFDSPLLAARAADLGLGSGDGTELLISRELVREGRGRARIEGRLATLSVLAELTAGAIEVVSQGEHQQLLRPERQAELLDAYAGQLRQVEALREAHTRWLVRAKELQERRVSAAQRARREDQLRFEVEQIDAVAPEPGELPALEAERGRLAHVERLREAAGAALDLLEGDTAARDLLARAGTRLGEALALDPSLASEAEGLERGACELAEVSRDLERYVAGLESDPTRLLRVEERLAQLARLQSRYGSTVEEILAHRERAARELEQLGGGEARTAALEDSLAVEGARLERQARELGRARRAAATDLARQVDRELAALELGRAHFEVRFEPLTAKMRDGLETPCSPRGRERASFWLAANPGEDARPLRDSASGGELARLSLALRNVLREADGGRVLLFDEIDAGIGGRTAHAVGERLRALAGSHQIVCITHLPQIAALADAHFRVSKRQRGSRTLTRVERLEDDARVEEIARMASGGRVTAVARAHARELLARGPGV
ncbi:MAG: DNA repair protein RecN [Myxococcota bacterium]